MEYQINGKCAFVNAGAHGIGEAIADLLTQEGANVIVADRDEAALHEKSHRWNDTVTADLATAEGVEKATSYVFAAFGRAPDILVNNLGVGNSASFPLKSCRISSGPQASTLTLWDVYEPVGL
jgi:NAD(P)-dependent dehydrogenase (short-subunit alcohol dehydrogenase family)